MNVKKDDLAIVTGSVWESPNIGRIVRVVAFVGNHPSLPEGNDWWLCEVAGSPVPDQFGRLKTTGHSRDIHLRPVSGLPDTEDTPTVVPIQEDA